MSKPKPVSFVLVLNVNLAIAEANNKDLYQEHWVIVSISALLNGMKRVALDSTQPREQMILDFIILELWGGASNAASDSGAFDSPR